jgi:hypothetical protein
MTLARFKIDYAPERWTGGPFDISKTPEGFNVYRRTGRIFRGWSFMKKFNCVEDARAFIDRVQKLPEFYA